MRTQPATWPSARPIPSAIDIRIADMDKEELKAQGLNDSIAHVDFMVGTADLSIVGTTHDGREVPVFVDGNFAL